jgi:hypothetical protein
MIQLLTVIRPPDGAEEFAVRHDLVGAVREVLHEIEFFWSQVDALSSNNQLTSLKIDLYVFQAKPLDSPVTPFRRNT